MQPVEIMLKRLIPILICLTAATVAYAQPGGGHGGGGGRGGGGGGSKPASSRPAGPKAAVKPVDQLEIIGVVKAIDVPGERITIAYEPVEALGWPAGAMPFPVAKTALLNGATVGEKVRFSIDSGHISAIRPFDTP